jgi:hypothetical protein
MILIVFIHFYLTKRNNAALHVLEYAKSLTSLGQFPVSILFHISIRDMLSETNREYGFLNILKKIKLKTAKEITLSSETENQSFITDELLQLYPGSRYIMCAPGVLLYYLMFISYHRLNDISRRQDCLHDLMLCVTTESPKFIPALQFHLLFYPRRAFEIISDTDGFYKCDSMIRTLGETTELMKLMTRNNC